MATSFLQNTEDTPVDILPNESTDTPLDQIPPEISEEQYDYTDEIPTTDETNTENEHFLEEETPPSTEIKTTIPEVQVKASSHQQAATPQKAIPPIPQVRDEIIVQIEKIMEEDLGDVFGALTLQQKQQFKIRGEETALKIRELLRGTKIKLGKIVNLIFDWLKLLPGINRFFLEQEAKIKAEKIANLHEQRKYTP